MPWAAAAIIGGAVISGASANKASKSKGKTDAAAIAASDRQADMANKLGMAELDFAKRQYAEAKPLADRVVNQQMDIAGKTAAQGDDYFNYLKTYRPTEQSMMYESMGLTPDQIDQLRSEQAASDQGILSGLVDEAPSQAEYATARDATQASLSRDEVYKSLQGQYTSTVTDPVVQGTKKKKGGFGSHSLGMKVLGSLTKGKGGGGPTSRQVIDSAGLNAATDKAFGEQTARQTAATAAEVRASGIRTQNSALRDKAAAAKDEVFYKYSSQAARAENARLDAAKRLDEADASIIGGSDADVYAARQAQIDAGVGTAIADTQEGYTRSVNQATRQGLRYGASDSKIVGDVGSMGLAQASNVAAAANGARTAGINTERGLANTRMGLRSTITSNMTQARAINWAKKLDATGLVRGVPGASQGAYGLAVGAGNSAMNNQQAPGNTFQAGLRSANDTRLSGARAQTAVRVGLTGQTDPMAQLGMAVGGKMMGAGMGYYAK